MKCQLCDTEIPAIRLKLLPDTSLCVKCSEKVDGDYEVKIIEENCGSSVLSKPIVYKTKRQFDAKEANCG